MQVARQAQDGQHGHGGDGAVQARLSTQCIQNVHPLSPGQPVLVGPAFTLRYIPAREDLNKLDVFRDRTHPQRKAVEDYRPVLSWSWTAARTRARPRPVRSW